MIYEYHVPGQISCGSAWENAENAFLNSFVEGESLKSSVIDILPNFDGGVYSYFSDAGESSEYSYILCGDKYFSDQAAQSIENILRSNARDYGEPKGCRAFEAAYASLNLSPLMGHREESVGAYTFPEMGSRNFSPINAVSENIFEIAEKGVFCETHITEQGKRLGRAFDTDAGGAVQSRVWENRLFTLDFYPAAYLQKKDIFSENGDAYTAFSEKGSGGIRINSYTDIPYKEAALLRFGNSAFFESAVNAKTQKSEQIIIFADTVTDMLISSEEARKIRGDGGTEYGGTPARAEISVDMSGMKNIINSKTDIDSLVTDLTEAVGEAVAAAAEGVYEL